MKRVLVITLSCLAACACGSADFSVPESPFKESGEVLMSVPDIPVVDNDSLQTKTQAVLSEQDGLSFKWSDDDKVNVYSTQGGMALFDLKAGGGNCSAIFQGSGFSLEAGSEYYAVYPYDGNALDMTALSFDYSQAAINAPDNLADILAFDYMSASAIADSDSHASFTFRHLSSFARLKLTLPKSETITSLDIIPTYDPLVDKISYNAKTGLATASSSAVVKRIKAANISGNKLSAWLPFAPQELSDAAVVVNTESGKIYTARLQSKDLKAGKAYRWNVEAAAYPTAPQSGIDMAMKYKNIISSVPSGQYSGITRISDNKYAVVHDKYKGGGILFFEFKLSSYGIISSLSYTIPEGTSESTNSRDPEGIVYVPSSNTLFVSGEADQQILEYDMNGRLTGRKLSIPSDMVSGKITGNCGFEALGYNANTGLLWTTTEYSLPKDKSYSIDSGLMIRLQSFSDKTLAPDKRYLYMIDAPQHTPVSGDTYAYGVPDILALDDGKLIVMEREAVVPSDLVSATTTIKFYLVDPVNDKGGILGKKLLNTISTSILAWANYEGMCLGPTLSGGTKTILLVNDSQDRYSSYLRDYLAVMGY